MSESRAPANYCPYCGETNLWPHEESHGAWSCRDCRRVFAVRFVGLAGGGNDIGNSAGTDGEHDVRNIGSESVVDIPTSRSSLPAGPDRRGE